MSSKVYQTNGSEYDPLYVLDKLTQSSLNSALYQSYGPLRISFMFAIFYGILFACIASILVHTALYHGERIVMITKRVFANNGDYEKHHIDEHCRLMNHYENVPDSWFIFIFAINLIVALIVCEVFGINLPWWALLLAILLAAIFVLPIGIITAIANQTPGLNIITEFVIGYILPGRPIANVTFKTYGYISMLQALHFLYDLKLGHYLKIPPKAMFMAQLAGTLIAASVNVIVAYIMFASVPGLCIDETGEFACPKARVFYSASVIWGVIGPKEMFFNSQYHVLLYAFLLGALLPFPVWLLARKYPNSFWVYVHVPVLLGATAVMPPAQAVMYPTWFIIGFIFMFWIKRYYFYWWQQYNYVLSAALSVGVVLGIVVGFSVFELPGVHLKWWGNFDPCQLNVK